MAYQAQESGQKCWQQHVEENLTGLKIYFCIYQCDYLRDEESSVRGSHENVHIKTGRTVGTEQVTREVVINLKETNIVCKILATRCD